MTKESNGLERKLEFTIITKKLSEGYMAQIKEMPCIMVYSESQTHLMEKLLTCLAGYTLILPHGDVPVELVQ